MVRAVVGCCVRGAGLRFIRQATAMSGGGFSVSTTQRVLIMIVAIAIAIALVVWLSMDSHIMRHLLRAIMRAL